MNSVAPHWQVRDGRSAAPLFFFPACRRLRPSRLVYPYISHVSQPLQYLDISRFNIQHQTGLFKLGNQGHI